MFFSGKIPSYVAARLTASDTGYPICYDLPRFATIRLHSRLFATIRTIRDYSHYLYHLLFAIRDYSLCTIRNYSLFAIWVFQTHEWLGRLKCLATGLDVFLSSFSMSQRCSRNRPPSHLPVSPIYNFLQRVQVMQMTLAEEQVKWSVILMDCLGPNIFSKLRMKGHVLHCACAQLNVLGWSLVWNIHSVTAPLTIKLPCTNQ